MPTKKKKKARQKATKSASAKRPKKASRKKPAKRAAKPTQKKQAPKKAAKPTRKARSPRRAAQRRESSWGSTGAVSGRQSGDLEGLSRAEQADSESVDELVEEGNIAEAGAVAGVEEADDEDTKEVHTHELLEDDVPEEYDQD